MSQAFAFNPKLDFAIERVIDAPTGLVWEALTTSEHLKEWYMPKPWGRVTRAEMDVRPGGIFSVDIVVGDGQDSQSRLLPRGGADGVTRLDLDVVPRLPSCGL